MGGLKDGFQGRVHGLEDWRLGGYTGFGLRRQIPGISAFSTSGVVVVGSVGLMHVAVMFVCWFVSTVLLDFLVVVVFLVVCIDFD